MVALADMPCVSPVTIQAIAARLREGAAIAAPFYRGQRGHPVGFSAVHRDMLLALHGDTGARPVLKRHAGQIVQIQVDDPGVLQDVDTRADADRLQKQ